MAIGKRTLHNTTPAKERAFLVAAETTKHTPGDGWSNEASLDELAMLADTAGAIVVGQTSQRMPRPNAAYYIGRGKLAHVVEQRYSLNYNTVIFNDELSPSQQRNLENELKVKVLDRTALILDIFAQHAHTREGTLQVELAQHEYILSRLRGQWSHLERLEGRIGTRGPGETQLETDRRLIRKKISRLKKSIERVSQQRSLYRRQRSKWNIPVVSLVGYTNAGKSTLMRALSGADVHIEERLFATLDPLTRRVSLPRGGVFLLTDTVGFIQKLPSQLVAAFSATLEELTEANLLVHVVDITHPSAEGQSQVVERALSELGLASRPILTALNKVDLLQDKNGKLITGLGELRDVQASLLTEHPGSIMISAARNWGIKNLLTEIERELTEHPSSVATSY